MAGGEAVGRHVVALMSSDLAAINHGPAYDSRGHATDRYQLKQLLHTLDAGVRSCPLR
jgi:hypothetical protein